MKKIAAIALLSAALPAFAASEGGCAGISLGSGKPGLAPTALTMSTSSSFIYGGFVGYQYSKNLAAEVQYGGVGKSTDVAGNATKTDALSLTVVGLLPLTDKLELIGKLGLANAKTTVSGSTATNTSVSRSGLTYGVGAQYNVNRDVALRLELNSYAVATGNAAGGKTNGNGTTANAEALYKF
jgi:OOP family OmpA-OmpF porin